MTIDRLRALVNADLDAVNALIIDKIQSQVGLIEDLSNHIVDSGGKRLRPLLVLLASHACGYEGRDHILLATMIEFIHTATLLHDDVVDESTLRRGRQTANSIWGSKASILVGDYLFTQAIQLIVQVGNSEILKLMTNTSLEISCGEVKQLANRHNPALTFDAYFDIIKAKTALLFASSSCIGAHLSGACPKTQQAMYDYGLHLGNAFQLIDDALDYSSNAQTLGKNIGDDLADGKATLPLIHALKYGTPKQQEQIKTSIQQASLEYLPEILVALEDTKAIEFTKSKAQEEIDKALSCLAVLSNSEYKAALEELAHFAVERAY